MPTLTLATLESKVYARVEGNSVFYDRIQDVDSKINEALKVTNLFAGWSQGRIPVGVTVAGRVFYSAPSGMLFTMKLYMDGREVPKESIKTLANTEQKWAQGSGVRVRYWAPVGINLFALYPSDKLGGRYLEAWGVTEPLDLINEGDTATIADELVDLVVDYAFFNLTLKEGGKVFRDASAIYKPWLKKINSLSMWERSVNPLMKQEVKQVA